MVVEEEEDEDGGEEAEICAIRSRFLAAKARVDQVQNRNRHNAVSRDPNHPKPPKVTGSKPTRERRSNYGRAGVSLPTPNAAGVFSGQAIKILVHDQQPDPAKRRGCGPRPEYAGTTKGHENAGAVIPDTSIGNERTKLNKTGWQASLRREP